MTINCRRIRDQKSEFAALVNYAKPDITIDTESWLRGIKPGKPPTESAIKSAEIFQKNFKVYRNDRGTLEGGVFIAVHSELVSIEQPEDVTECEIEWVKIKLKNSKDLYISSFYMPHRNINDLNKLSESITMVNNERKTKTYYTSGRFQLT
jgi:hypothetical protein